MNRPRARGRHHAASRMTAPIVEANIREGVMADSRTNTFTQKTPRLGHPSRPLDSHSRAAHPGCEVTPNHGHYYIEMVETIAAWLKGARVRALR